MVCGDTGVITLLYLIPTAPPWVKARGPVLGLNYTY